MKGTLRHTIAEALKEVLGRDVYIPSLYSGKLKGGTRVYRITGSTGGGDYMFKRDGKVWLRKQNCEPVHITKEMADGDYQRDDISFNRWEWRLLDRGYEVIEAELDKAIHARGVYNVEVQVGGGHSSYPTSMAFKVISKKQGPPPELVLLFSSLPPAGEPWPGQERDRWLQTAARMFDLMYGPAA